MFELPPEPLVILVLCYPDALTRMGLLQRVGDEWPLAVPRIHSSPPGLSLEVRDLFPKRSWTFFPRGTGPFFRMFGPYGAGETMRGPFPRAATPNGVFARGYQYLPLRATAPAGVMCRR